jgi:hypothetical protein
VTQRVVRKALPAPLIDRLIPKPAVRTAGDSRSIAACAERPHQRQGGDDLAGGVRDGRRHRHGAEGDCTAEIALVVDDAVQRGGIGPRCSCGCATSRTCVGYKGCAPRCSPATSACCGCSRIKNLPFRTSFARESDVVTVGISVEAQA